ncbi:hypothetical protein [Lacticaseibacillus paracasei]|uniref:hypothetical protein n=1 Tax=Lacticaseibacillus paracasei TaxID=1597 RepID=UPI003B9F1A56
MTKTAYRKAALVDVKHDRDKWVELGALVKEHYLVRSMTPKDWFIIVKQREGYEIEVYPTFEMSDGFQFSHVNLLTRSSYGSISRIAYHELCSSASDTISSIDRMIDLAKDKRY